MADDEAPTSLWQFAVHGYALPEVAERSVQLQDEYGLDVDVIFAVLWSAMRGVELDEALLARTVHAAAPARERVLAIRALRRSVGDERARDPRWGETYARLKAAELAAERVQLAAMEAVAPTPSRSSDADPVALARRSLRRYAAYEHRAEATALLDELVDRVLGRGRSAADVDAGSSR